MSKDRRTTQLARFIVESRARYESHFKISMRQFVRSLELLQSVLQDRREYLMGEYSIPNMLYLAMILRMTARDVKNVLGRTTDRSINRLFDAASAFLANEISSGRLHDRVESNYGRRCLRAAVDFHFSRLERPDPEYLLGCAFIMWDLLNLVSHNVGKTKHLSKLLDEMQERYAPNMVRFARYKKLILPAWICFIAPQADLQDPCKKLDLVYLYMETVQTEEKVHGTVSK